MSACTSSVSDVKEVVKVARNEKRMFGRRTVLFMDEVHRFNKLQQDAFLPHVEDGTITLVGATTENPSFSLNRQHHSWNQNDHMSCRCMLRFSEV